MKAHLEIHPTEATREGFAVIDLLEKGKDRLCQLDLQFSKLSVISGSKACALDLLLLASGVYSLDKQILRSSADDGWTRDLQLSVPVSDVATWKSTHGRLNECLSFLTGDDWNISFSRRVSKLLRPVRRRRRRRLRLVSPPAGDAVSLFSGGLDSLIGVIDWLETNPKEKILLVGHHDGEMAGPFADQRALLEPLKLAYPGRISSILVRVGHSGDEDTQKEISLRSRSLLFIAIGLFAASALGENVPLLIPENGPIALNVPLTPSRRGSCSTRTTHPYFLQMLAAALRDVDLHNPVQTPLESKTKGEAVTQCLNQALLEATARISVSCAKRGHKRHFTHRQARACGRCMPCIYRRAALHAAGWDDEPYGDDICAGEVDLNAEGEKPNDLRACFSFLQRNPSASEIGVVLLANGSLDPIRLLEYADLVQRSMEEIRELLRDKGSRKIKRLAGL